MKVAVFKSHDEIIILPIKGKGGSAESVDGFDEWFGTDRNVSDFDVSLCHIGAGSGVHISAKLQTDWLDRTVDIGDWFDQE